MFVQGNFYFNPHELQATSYSWWSMLTVIGGKLVRNRCGYSMQTSQHQNTLSKILKVLGISPDIEVHTRSNIGNVSVWRGSALYELAQAMVRNKHGRNKVSESKLHEYKEFHRLVKLKIFKPYTAKELAKEVQDATEARSRKLEYIRERRKRKQAESIPVQPLLRIV